MTTGVRSGIGLVELLEQMIGWLLVEMSKTWQAMKAYAEAPQATTASVQASLGSMESIFFYLVGWDLTPLGPFCRSPRFL
jgi:hypothetical protein